MRWTWDPNKNEANKRKHRISFEKAEFVFIDSLSKTEFNSYAPDASEERFQTIGMVDGQVIFVVHTFADPGSDSDAFAGRIISARKANRPERQEYEESRL